MAAIGIFKLFKSLVLIVLATEALQLVHRDIATMARRWIEHSRVDPGNRYLNALLEKLPGLTPQRLKLLSIGTFIYAMIYLIEGVVLLRRKRWAEYLTVISTVLLLPIEIIELVHRVTPPRMGLLLVNLAVAAYLSIRLWQSRSDRATGRGST